MYIYAYIQVIKFNEKRRHVIFKENRTNIWEGLVGGMGREK